MQEKDGENHNITVDKRLAISILVFAALAMMVLAVVSMEDSSTAGQNDVQKPIDNYSGQSALRGTYL